MAHPDEGRAGGPVAPRGPVPPRRFGAAHRYRTPARAFRHRPLFGGAPSPHGMTVRFPRAAATVALLLGATRASAAQGAASDTSSVAAARRLLDAAERELAVRAVKVNRAGWVGENFITHDTEILASDAQAGGARADTRLVDEARRFDGVALPADVRRRILLLKLQLAAPAPPASVGAAAWGRLRGGRA